MNSKVDALRSICKKIDEKIKVIETQLFSEQKDNDQTEIIEPVDNKEKSSIYKYNIN